MSVHTLTVFNTVAGHAFGITPYTAVAAGWSVSDVNGATGTQALSSIDDDIYVTGLPTDFGVLTSDVITEVVIEFDWVVVSDPGVTMRMLSTAGIITPDVVGGGSGHESRSIMFVFGGGPIDRATLFAFANYNWETAWQSTAGNVNVTITNFRLVVTDDAVSLSLSPEFGTQRGGTVVTLTGSGFTGVTSVTFGGTAASGIHVINDTTLTCVTPAHATGVFDVTVVGVGTVTNGFTFVGVDRVSPRTGTVAGGTAVTITGFGFTTPATGVLFDTTAATDVVIVSDTSITAVTPAHASGVVDVTVSGVDVGEHLYTYTLTVPQNLGKGALLPPIPTRRTA